MPVPFIISDALVPIAVKFWLPLCLVFLWLWISIAKLSKWPLWTAIKSRYSISSYPLL